TCGRRSTPPAAVSIWLDLGGLDRAPQTPRMFGASGRSGDARIHLHGAPTWPPNPPSVRSAAAKPRRSSVRALSGGFGGGLFGRAGAVLADAGGPASALVGGHVAVRCEARIGIVPVLDVDEVLGPRDERALADGLARGTRQLGIEAPHQLTHDGRRHPRPLAGVDEAEDQQVVQ